MENGELTLRDIAGFCPEEAVWKMLADVSRFVQKEGTSCTLTPDTIVIDGDSFMVIPSANAESTCETTSQKALVWSLGAVAYFTATGHVVFGGHGESYQQEHPSVPLPVLPKDFQALTPVLQKCLCYLPDDRMSMEELMNLSQKGLEACAKRQRTPFTSSFLRPIGSKRPKTERGGEVSPIGEGMEGAWPEEMIEL